MRGVTWVFLKQAFYPSPIVGPIGLVGFWAKFGNDGFFHLGIVLTNFARDFVRFKNGNS
jgi:hypothetical protein